MIWHFTWQIVDNTASASTFVHKYHFNSVSNDFGISCTNLLNGRDGMNPRFEFELGQNFSQIVNIRRHTMCSAAAFRCCTSIGAKLDGMISVGFHCSQTFRWPPDRTNRYFWLDPLHQCKYSCMTSLVRPVLVFKNATRSEFSLSADWCGLAKCRCRHALMPLNSMQSSKWPYGALGPLHRARRSVRRCFFFR